MQVELLIQEPHYSGTLHACSVQEGHAVSTAHDQPALGSVQFPRTNSIACFTAELLTSASLYCIPMLVQYRATD